MDMRSLQDAYVRRQQREYQLRQIPFDQPKRSALKSFAIWMAWMLCVILIYAGL